MVGEVENFLNKLISEDLMYDKFDLISLGIFHSLFWKYIADHHLGMFLSPIEKVLVHFKDKFGQSEGFVFLYFFIVFALGQSIFDSFHLQMRELMLHFIDVVRWGKKDELEVRILFLYDFSYSEERDGVALGRNRVAFYFCSFGHFKFK